MSKTSESEGGFRFKIYTLVIFPPVTYAPYQNYLDTVRAPNVVWNAPFKAKIQELYNNWMLNKEETVTGKPRPPSMTVYLEWICKAWNALPKEMIAKSFKGPNALYGSEDDDIHCFNDHWPVAEGRQMLQGARLTATDDLPAVEKVDSHEDEENGYLSDESLSIEL